jgi:hypothetical protein
VKTEVKGVGEKKCLKKITIYKGGKQQKRGSC